MIVKILSSARNFEGIDYSERKNDQGKSHLLVAKNFGALGHQVGEVKKVDYVNYMKMVSDANTRVKKRQFHAVISAKEKSHSPEKLANIAEQYLKSMGYGENPYLIYFHRDTNNNHVHMVSTRVDKNGKKVDDSYEKIRSQKVLQQILEQDPTQETKAVLEKALKYQFSTKAQFKLLLEEQGFKITENDKLINLIKYGLVQRHYSKTDLAHKLSTYNPPEDRIRQLKAIFIKYKKGLDLEVFKNKMHSKFGIMLVFHQNKSHNLPYGYTIIDHKKKQVFKGSQIVQLKQLLLPVSSEGRIQLLNDLLANLDLTSRTYHDLNRELNVMGFVISKKGEISAVDNPKILSLLHSGELKQLNYNSRLKSAKKYLIDTNNKKQLVSKLYNIDPENLSITNQTDHETSNYFKNLLLNANQSTTLGEALEDKKLKVLRFESSYFLWDKTNHHLFEIKQLLGEHMIDLKQVTIMDINESRLHENQIQKSSSLSQLAQLFDLSIAEPERQNDRKKSKRKQQNF